MELVTYRFTEIRCNLQTLTEINNLRKLFYILNKYIYAGSGILSTDWDRNDNFLIYNALQSFSWNITALLRLK